MHRCQRRACCNGLTGGETVRDEGAPHEPEPYSEVCGAAEGAA